MNKAVWFRNDLRTIDNPALSSALCSKNRVFGFYIYTPKQLEQHHVGKVKRHFILQNVVCLKNELQNIGIPLVIVRGKTYADSVKKLEKLCKTHHINEVFANTELELNEKKRDTLAEQTLAKTHTQIKWFNDQTLLPPGTIMTDKGSPFRVFSPFKKSWLKQIESQSISPLPKPRKPNQNIEPDLEEQDILKWEPSQPQNDYWKPGSKEAFKRLRLFLKEHANDYHTERDIPSKASTSQLSPYLSIGAISVRSCFYAAFQANEYRWDFGSQGLLTWINELIWREFYKNLTHFNPNLCKGDAFQSKTSLIPWSRNEFILNAWKAGETGYPLVDAGMRQLNETGWMHNRLRMVTAMFLTKHLFINWRMGEKYFMEMLIDADFSANNGGWQWCASTGADAAPYFRIFNPERQSQRFDPQGEYIRFWVSELANIPNANIHNPTENQRIKCHYPPPIVNHKEATQRTKEAFQSIRLLEAP